MEKVVLSLDPAAVSIPSSKAHVGVQFGHASL